MNRWMSTAFGVALLSCGGHRAAPAPAPEAASAAVKEVPVRFTAEPAQDGLQMVLYDARPAGVAAAGAPVAAGAPLEGARLDALLERLPPLDDDAAAQPFALRPASTPPPRTGATVVEAFPPTSLAGAPPAVEPGPLSVLRRAPEGEVAMAPHLSVTFSQAMVAVGAVAEVNRSVPVRLVPEPPGSWRWVGARTLVFQPEGRFPMATEYRVEVPAGARSAGGAALGATVGWGFATPAVTLDRFSPGVALGRGDVGDTPPQGLEPLVWLGFDQAVDPAAMGAHVTLAGPDGPVALRPATAEEIARDPDLVARRAAGQPGRDLVLRPAAPLRPASTYTVSVPRGAPSAEGPRRTAADQTFRFRTYDRLRVADVACWWGAPCPPESPWSVRLTNPLDEAAFDPATITIEPPVPDLSIQASGDGLQVSGSFTGRTRYVLTLPANLRDTFGQTLGVATPVTLSVGPASRRMTGPSSPMVVVDPAGAPTVSFHTTNVSGLRVRASRVRPEDWGAWTAWLERYRYEDARPAPLPGQAVADVVVRVKGSPDALTETAVDLAPWLRDDLGHLVLWVEPTEQPRDRWDRQEWFGWVQRTRIGLTAIVDGTDVYGWATDLGDGRALAGVDLSLDGAAPVRTGADGLVALPLRAEGSAALVARRGADAAILPASPYGWGGDGWHRAERSDRLAWYLADDRHLYKPGETVHLKGWVRRIEGAKGGDVRALGPAPATVRWTLHSSMGNELGSGTATLGPLGGFDLAHRLPDTPDLGPATFTFRLDAPGLDGAEWSHGIDVQEFRTPEFEVVTSGADGTYALGEDAVVDVAARYYAGGGLPNAPVTWRVRATPASFVPPGREDWSFGAFRPWWWLRGPEGEEQVVEWSAATDGLGEHHLGIHFEALRPARPMSVSAEATVMDVNRQAWSSSRTLLLHPASVYVGLKLPRPFVEKGQEVAVSALVVDRAGAAVAGLPVSLRFARLTWARVGERWEEIEERTQECRLTPGADGASCAFRPDGGGVWRATAVVRDAQGRPNESEVRVWVAGADAPPDRGVSAEEVRLIPDRERYAPGERARVLVQAPFFPADGVLTVQRDGVVATQTFRMEEPTHLLEVPIDESLLPGVRLQVDLVGSAPRAGDDGVVRPDLPRRMAFATGGVDIQVPPLSRTLAVSVTPAATRVEPGARSAVRVSVRDAQDRPVAGAELAVVAVDEAVLALSGYRMPDPIGVFYGSRSGGAWSSHQRAWAQLAAAAGLVGGRGEAYGAGGLGLRGAGPGGGGMVEGSVVARVMEAPMADMAAMPMAAPPAPSEAKRSTADGERTNAPDPGSPVALRTDFDPLALWAPSVRTDAAGVAEVPLELPDSLTRYRIMVVAVAGERQFGSGEADLTARLPLMVRPSPPRFLNFGDRFELPVVVQNQTDAPLDVEVGVRAINLDLGAGGRAGRVVRVPANDRIEVRFPAAAQEAGEARFQAVVSAGGFADAASGELPVWTPASTEAFATYGTIAEGAVSQPVAVPTDVWPQFGGLEVTTSSTQLQALTDAFLYLVAYPYDCNEQIASRVLGVAALRDVLGAFAAEGLPPKAELEQVVAADLERLGRRQNADGGWAFWRRGDPSWPYLSIHVTHALVRAGEKGYAVDPRVRQRALDHLRRIEGHIPHWYSERAKWSLRAYALYVRALAGDADPGKAKKLLAESGVDELPMDAQGWILPTLHAARAPEAATIRGWLANHVTESAAGAHFVTDYSDGAHVLLHSDRRVDGVVLDALLRTEPQSDLVPKVVNGLLAHRTRGRWSNTGENALILLALDRYFQVYEGVTPDFVARAWLGDGFVGEHAFRGRTTERSQMVVPMAWLTERGGTPELVLQKQGAGRLYYRIGMSYAPTDLTPPPIDQGFAVERSYAAVDDPADVRRDADGVWHVKAGARVRVSLEMATPMRRYHVALVDPLPAGLEVVNPDLAVSGALPPDPNQPQSPFWWWSRTWYEHENLRDERVEAFTTLLWDGVHRYSYVARATTPGRFVVPGAKAEEMYSPETFGRAAGDVLVVE